MLDVIMESVSLTQKNKGRNVIYTQFKNSNQQKEKRDGILNTIVIKKKQTLF